MKEINVTDVMLGDWVLYEHKNTKWETESTHYLKVENITSRDICMRNGDYARVQCVGYGCIKPIPLTAEILEKNGFKLRNRYIWERKDNYCCVKLNISPKIEIDGELLDEHPPILLEVDGATFSLNIIVKYVHELQHALRLCGVEKKINL